MHPRSKRPGMNVRNNWLERDPVEEAKMEELPVQLHSPVQSGKVSNDSVQSGD